MNEFNSMIKCDLCNNESEYHLCQQHIDDLKFPDVFSTENNDYPDENQQVLWSNGRETYVGGYNRDTEKWFTQGDEEVESKQVYWCYLPDLLHFYRFFNEPDDLQTKYDEVNRKLTKSEEENKSLQECLKKLYDAYRIAKNEKKVLKNDNRHL